jgi:signal transduction histidine kinase
MTRTGHCTDETRKRDPSSRLRAKLGWIVERIVDLNLPIMNDNWPVSRDPLLTGTQQYADALLHAAETGDPGPIDEFFASLDQLWQAEAFAIDPLIRCLFNIEDLLRASIPEPDAQEFRRKIREYTRHSVQVLSQRSVNIVLSRLSDQVEEHRAGEERLTGLHRVGAALGGDLDLNRALTMIAEEARTLIGADGLGIRLVTEDNRLEFVTGIGDDQHILRPYTLEMHESLSGAVFTTRAPIRVDDALNDDRVSTYFRRGGGRSLLIVPMLARDRTIGIIGGVSTRTSAFSDSDERMLQLFADQAANVIENARLYEQATSQINELEMLHRVSQVISASLELDEIFQNLYEEIQQLMPADAFLIALARPDGLHDIEFIVDDGQRYPPQRGVSLSDIISEGLIDGDPVIRQDITSHPGYKHVNRFGNLRKTVRSLIAAPLIRGSKTIGVISAQSYDLHDYREPEARLMRTIANQAAIAIEHARLYQQAQNMAIAEERARLAREIHDTLAQGMIGIILCLERLDLTVPANDAEFRPWIERALELSRNNLDEARRSVRDLRAAPLEGRTLGEAVANLIASTADDVDFDVHATLPPSLPPLSARVETALFRVVQEAISNARKHAQCSSLTVSLELTEHYLSVCITDDGTGFSPEPIDEPVEHYGITTMRERVQQIGGTLAIDSSPGNGTDISIALPIELAMQQEIQNHPPEKPPA